MQRTDFKESMSGKLLKTPQGFVAFVPNPLPPPINLDLKTIRSLSDADRALGQLAGIGQMLPNPHLLIGPFLRREAILSSRIEGTIASAQQLVMFEMEQSGKPSTPDVREVSNYVSAIEYGLRRLKELPLSLRLIQELHERLLKGVRGQEHRPGEFRKVPNFIGQPGQSVEGARYVPPPVMEMTQTLDDFERYLAVGNALPVLVKIALIHYQFEAIHPFRDGNGRIGRLLITLMLCELGVLPQPLLYLSAYFERNREAYMDHLLRVSQAGAWSDWIRFFLVGVTEQSLDAIKRSNQLLDLWKKYRNKLQSVRVSALSLRLVDELFKYPATSVTRAARQLHITPRAAQLNVDKLVKAGLLKEATGRRRNRIYLAQEIIHIIEAP